MTRGATQAPALIAIVTPAGRGERSGNRVTALRWARLLRQLGHRPTVQQQLPAQPLAAVLAVHARKSAAAIAAATARGLGARSAVLLAGTDIYPSFRADAVVLQCLQQAHRIVVLQPKARDLLPLELRDKVRVLVQSATPVAGRPPSDCLQACVLAHLRAVKDPLLPFAALLHVPGSARLRVVLAGKVLDAELGARAQHCEDARAVFLGERTHRAAKELIAGSHLCIVPSHGEGGANVLSEAIAMGTPVLATAIPGNTGLLGDDWPGLFAPGDARALGQLLTRAVNDRGFVAELRRRTAALQPLVHPDRERKGLAELLAELGVAKS